MSQSNTLWPVYSRIQCVKTVMFKIKFTYLKILDVTWDFWFGRVIQNIRRTQYKSKLHIAKYSSCNIQFNHNTNGILITGLYDVLAVIMLGILSRCEEIHGLKPAQAHCTSFACWFILFVGLIHVYTLLPHWSD